MRAGLLRHRIRIQRDIGTGRTATGAKIEVWQDVANVAAEVTFVAGREFARGGTMIADVTHAISIRHRTGIRPHMRVLWQDRVLDIDQAGDPNGRGRELQLLCREVVR